VRTVTRPTFFLVATLGATALNVSAIAPVLADDCQAVQSSLVAQASTPYAETTTSGSHPGLTVRNVSTSTHRYIQSQGAWTTVPETSAERLKELADQMASQKRACRRTGAESIGGQAADVYAVSVDADGSTSRMVFWISKAMNLPLKRTFQLGNRPPDVSTYTYDNVKPPAGAR